MNGVIWVVFRNMNHFCGLTIKMRMSKHSGIYLNHLYKKRNLRDGYYKKQYCSAIVTMCY